MGFYGIGYAGMRAAECNMKAARCRQQVQQEQQRQKNLMRQADDQYNVANRAANAAQSRLNGATQKLQNLRSTRSDLRKRVSQNTQSTGNAASNLKRKQAELEAAIRELLDLLFELQDKKPEVAKRYVAQYENIMK